MPAYCQFRCVTCNNNEKLLCASCSALFICFRSLLQLPQGSSLVSSNKSNLTVPSHSFFILIAIPHSQENSLMERLSSLVHVFYGNELAYKREHIFVKRQLKDILNYNCQYSTIIDTSSTSVLLLAVS